MSEAASNSSSSTQTPIDNKELTLGKTLVENLTSKQFDISQYSDEYTKQLEQLINAKSSGKKTLRLQLLKMRKTLVRTYLKH
jgi:non-homologous end joining protein Ku